MVADILYALVLVLGVTALLALAVGWTRYLAELLWLGTIRPRLVAATALAAFVFASVSLRAAFGLAPIGPLSFSIALILAPYVVVPLSNYLAFRWRGDDDRSLDRKDFIFEAKRRAQRRSYEAPRNEQ